ncbi:hypothetical protein MMC07_007882 [Pseudocyphellaria aurata]|nr:hypothetical protein [Pseudocyphellaria aurata]
MNTEFHIEASISLYSSVFNRHKADQCSRDIVRQLELQNLAWLRDDSREIVPAECISNGNPSVIRALCVILNLSEKGTSVPELVVEMAAQLFHFSEALVVELVNANNIQLREGAVPIIWAVAFALHRYSLGDSAKYITQELETYWFDVSESLVEGIIKAQQDQLKQEI